MNLIFIIHNLKIFMLSKTLIKCFPPVKISSSVNLNFFAYSCYFALYNSLRGKKSFHWTYSEFSIFIVLTSLAEVLFCDELAKITTQNNAIDIEMLSHNTWNNEVVSTSPSWKFEKNLGNLLFYTNKDSLYSIKLLTVLIAASIIIFKLFT